MATPPSGCRPRPPAMRVARGPLPTILAGQRGVSASSWRSWTRAGLPATLPLPVDGYHTGHCLADFEDGGVEPVDEQGRWADRDLGLPVRCRVDEDWISI